MVVEYQQELLKQFLECKALALHFFNRIRNCPYRSGASARIAQAILGVQSAGFALF